MKKRIVLVLKTGGDFNFNDARLLAHHIMDKWDVVEPPEIVCFWDKICQPANLAGMTFLPLTNGLPGVWSRMILYSPAVENLKPFLYIDLDTAVLRDLNNIFTLVENRMDQWVTLEDFYQTKELATGLVWFPAQCAKTLKVWKEFQSNRPKLVGRMDYFLRGVTSADEYWQNITNTVVNFKPKATPGKLLQQPGTDVNLVCFHGFPRIPEAINVGWVDKYIKSSNIWFSDKKI